MPTVTDYNAAIDAFTNFYNTDSQAAWNIINQYNLQPTDLYELLPSVDKYLNNNGSVTGYAYKQPLPTGAESIAGQINSNLQLPTQGNGTTFQGNIVGNGDFSGTGGSLNMSNGAKKTSDGSSIVSTFGRIGTAVAGLSIGTRLGTNILDSIYRGNPDYWDEKFPAINPQTWDSIAGTNELGKSVINAIFGIDKTNNRTQMYIPEDAFAYFAYGMSQEGFFSTGEIKGQTGTISGVTPIHPPFEFSQYPYASGATYPTNASNRIGTINYTSPIYCYRNPLDKYGYYYVRLYSKEPFKVRQDITESAVHSQSSTIQGKPVYSSSIQFNRDSNSAPLSIVENSEVLDPYMGYDMLYTGTVEEYPSKEGVDKQDGATYPTTTNWTDPEATRQNIRTQYPDLYNNSIYNDVPQPDGTVQRIIYYPVNMTETSGATETEPTNTTVTYNNTYVDDSSADDLLKTVLRYFYQTESDTKSDTPNPPDTPNPTDTGSGNTPVIPPITGSAASLWAVYNPSQAELNSFGAWLWSSNFIDQILKLFNNPMQSIIGVHKIFATPPTSGSASIKVGYLDSGVSANVVSAQYVTIDCGSVNVREQFGNVFDYEDTQIRLYLPFIGIVQLDTNDVMRGSVKVVYHVDVITGACLAEVRVTRDASGGTLYQFSGDAAVRYPISSGSYMGVVSGVLGVVGGIASGIMSGGATLPMAAGAIAGGLSGAKTQVQHSGSFAGNAGAMGAKKPYLIIERPQTAVADGYGNYQGTGSNRVALISSMSGYFKMTDIHTDSITGAAESEIEAVRAALAGGVIA